MAKGFDDGLVTGMILIDLQKAFDMIISHDTLLRKLSIIVFLITLLNSFNLIYQIEAIYGKF